MSTVVEAVAALRAVFLTIAPPAGVSLGTRVWAWPADRASVSYETFPFVLCAQVLNENGVWRPASQGVGYHIWPAEVMICIAPFATRDDVSAADEASAQAWLLAAATVFFDNRGLGGTALDIGNDAGLFTSQIGPMGWLSGQTFWGVYCRAMVQQQHSLPSI
jgi:hypothetical protein